jgi:hypothetical protein
MKTLKVLETFRVFVGIGCTLFSVSSDKKPGFSQKPGFPIGSDEAGRLGLGNFSGGFHQARLAASCIALVKDAFAGGFVQGAGRSVDGDRRILGLSPGLDRLARGLHGGARVSAHSLIADGPALAAANALDCRLNVSQRCSLQQIECSVKRREVYLKRGNWSIG